MLLSQELDALLGDGLRDEDAHGQALADIAVSPDVVSTARSAAARAAFSATPVWIAIPILERDVTEVPDAEDLAGQGTLSAREHEAALTEGSREGAPVDVHGQAR